MISYLYFLPMEFLPHLLSHCDPLLMILPGTLNLLLLRPPVLAGHLLGCGLRAVIPVAEGVFVDLFDAQMVQISNKFLLLNAIFLFDLGQPRQSVLLFVGRFLVGLLVADYGLLL